MTSLDRHEPTRAYAPIAMSAESTVVAQFVPDEAGDRAYQSESDLERALTQLEAQAYEYLPITSEADLIDNVRRQLEGLNGIRFSDTEWTTFFSERIASANSGMEDKTIRLQEDHVQLSPATTARQRTSGPRQAAHPQQPAPGHQPVRDRGRLGHWG